LRSILARFYTADILLDEYRFSESGVYYAPNTNMNRLRAYIESLPLTEKPEIFGMHENANISHQVQEAKKLVRTVLETQPRVVSTVGGKSSEEEVVDIAESIIAEWPDLIAYDLMDLDSNPVAKALFEVDSNGRMLNSLSTVLIQETDRFNKLISAVKHSLETLIKAIKGLVVMSPDLEAVFRSLLNNEVPAAWAHLAYPSLKPLGSWVKDLLKRVQFIRTWMNRGQPQTFWISGFFFPQGPFNY
jgi:dynein heavy chain